jgi:hypothetical protein
LERHSNFDENGFHWHLLVKGVDFIPHDILKEAWRSARHGVAYIVDVQAIRKPHVIGYVTKYLTKSLSRGEKGVRHEEREVRGISQNEDGNVVEERHTYTVELVSRARRIRYSRHFFPEKVSDLRARLFAEIEQGSMEQTATASSTEDSIVDEAGQLDNGKPVEEEKAVKRSSWSLVKCEEFTEDIQEYRRRRRKALVEALIDLREGRNLSRRVINIWAYQRNELRWAS